jgi:hypothetical protein
MFKKEIVMSRKLFFFWFFHKFVTHEIILLEARSDVKYEH